MASVAVTLTDLAAPAPIHVSGGRYSLNGGPFTSAPGTIRSGDTLRVSVKASIDAGDHAEAVIDIGGANATFRAQTRTQALVANKRVGGASPTHSSLAAAVDSLEPGDVLDVAFGTYPALVFDRAGTADKPIIVRGVANAQGRRPVIQGVTSNTTVLLAGSDHLVIDNFEITNGPSASIASSGSCLRNVAHEVTLQRVWVRDCLNHGILGADLGGSLTLDRVEVTGAGCSPGRGHSCAGGNEKHPVYVATHPVLHPHAFLRITDSHFHANRTGETVKSRAQRVEIRYSRIESVGQGYGALGLFGYDLKATKQSASVAAPIHHDIVGNLLVARDDATSVARFGGDGSGSSFGCTRFVGNTVLVSQNVAANESLIRLAFALQGFVAHNNIFSVVGPRSPGAPADAFANALIAEESNFVWADAGKPKLLITHNHVPNGSNVLRLKNGTRYTLDGDPPSASTGMVLGNWVTATAPGMVGDASFDALNPALKPSSPLRAAGVADARGAACAVPAGLTAAMRNAVSPQGTGQALVRGGPRTDTNQSQPALGAFSD